MAHVAGCLPSVRGTGLNLSPAGQPGPALATVDIWAAHQWTRCLLMHLIVLFLPLLLKLNFKVVNNTPSMQVLILVLSPSGDTNSKLTQTAFQFHKLF